MCRAGYREPRTKTMYRCVDAAAITLVHTPMPLAARSGAAGGGTAGAAATSGLIRLLPWRLGQAQVRCRLTLHVSLGARPRQLVVSVVTSVPMRPTCQLGFGAWTSSTSPARVYDYCPYARLLTRRQGQLRGRPQGSRGRAAAPLQRRCRTRSTPASPANGRGPGLIPGTLQSAICSSPSASR